MSKLQRPMQNIALIALTRLNVSGVLLIRIDSHNYITLGAAKCFFIKLIQW